MKNGRSRMKNPVLRKWLVSAVFLSVGVLSAFADDRSGRIQIGAGLLYRNGMELTAAYEHETNYHHAWEYFGSVYLQWKECPSCGHICPESFWHNYSSWSVGAAYKPCVVRGKNHHGNLRLGGSLGSDRHHLLGGIHAGYEHSYSLRKGWQVYWQVKTDLMISGRDLFRTGVAIGVKIPTGK